jgi:hypothetical protein
MSYRPLANEDSLSELFSRMNDFLLLSVRLMNSKEDISSFAIWLYKCAEVDRRSTYFFLKNKRKELSDKEWAECVRVIPALGQERMSL